MRVNGGGREGRGGFRRTEEEEEKDEELRSGPGTLRPARTAVLSAKSLEWVGKVALVKTDTDPEPEERLTLRCVLAANRINRKH